MGSLQGHLKGLNVGKKKEVPELIDEVVRERKIAVAVWYCGIHSREHKQKHGTRSESE
jgi:hypothetical protein